MYSSLLFSPDLYGLHNKKVAGENMNTTIIATGSAILWSVAPVFSNKNTYRSDGDEVIGKTELFIHSNCHLPISSNPMLIIIIIIIII
jgi:hypothetical protein